MEAEAVEIEADVVVVEHQGDAEHLEADVEVPEEVQRVD